MRKIKAIVLVLLVCALLLGVGGGVLLAGEEGKAFDATSTINGGSLTTVVFFECPVSDPNCDPPNIH